MSGASEHGLIRAVAVDFDGTLAEGGRPADGVLAELGRYRSRGGRAVLVTGRIMSELREVFPDVEEHVDVIVAENGATVCRRGVERLLAEPVEPALEEALRRDGVPVRRGRVLLAMHAADHDAAAREILRLGLELHLVRNRGELMVLPSGASKGSGVAEGLAELHVSRHNAVAIGDAENDHSLLGACEVGVAVANAVPSLREHADLVTMAPDGEGVASVLAGELLAGGQRPPSSRWRLRLGVDESGADVTLPATPSNVLVCGPSGSGKSHVAGLLAEGLIRQGYSLLVVDPEGDYEALADLPGVVTLGGSDPLPSPERILEPVGQLGSVVVDLSLRGAGERRDFYRRVPAMVEATRSALGVPHWLIVDEAHEYLGASHPDRRAMVPERGGYCCVSYHPEELPPEALAALDAVILLPGAAPPPLPRPRGRSARVARLLARARRGQAVLLEPGPDGASCRLVSLAARETHHVRHHHKYVSGLLPAPLRFYFRAGHDLPAGMPAANVMDLYRELGRCEPSVVAHHCAGGDFSRWLEEVLADRPLATRMAQVEARAREDGSPSGIEEARQGLLRLIEERYIA